ncbi:MULTISPECIES: sodium:solute symporter family transporter [Alteromonadaceae]|uniref:sodium:solute symporter family transporter n=1 Tax=Alteromonadaceae TaxID=72275 RepID=UPI001C0A1A62|nr:MULTISPECIES: transporter [Aliiglaciecola]MBU2879290.1 transporter [Aliiglaciecola lipolytica]MDO6709742.1 transporter [Aliiglaciecola sp. 2_MG-2023]MDO6750716.1 transporter [Aliiglaciecola sp. 1_MG-2023]
MLYEYIVIAGYFMLVIGIGFAFKKMAANSTSDYFRGGGRMLWWMVGSTAFMAQFSAWTFTGGAGKAFTDGFSISLVFFANTFAYFCGWAFFAARFRQMRVDTPTEGIKRRFGHQNEQFFSWALIIFSFINAGVWLNALGVFTSVVFDADVSTTIIATGLTVLFVSVLSGAWGVVASDFVQTLVVAVISIACAIIALVKVGGPTAMIDNFPVDFVMGPDMNYGLILVATFVFFLAKQMITIMNMHDSFRFLNAKDSANASKAALLAMVLMGVGSIIWFIPPWASATLYPDAAAAYPELGNKAADAVYLVFTRNAMPVGTVGLLLAGLFAATMSSMDSALNKNSGIFVRSIYQPLLTKRNKDVSDKHLLTISQIVSFISGILVIAVALFFKSLKELSLFDLMMNVSTMIQVPLLIPLIFGLFIKKTPQWAPWATVIVGLFVSWFAANIFTPQVLADLIGMEQEFTRRESIDINLMITIGGHLLITASFFCISSLFYSEQKDQHINERELFFEDLETPFIADFEQDEFDRQQRHKLGSMVMYMGAGVLAMMLIPNPMWGRLVFVCCALAILAVGFLLKRSATSKKALSTA